MGCGAGFQRGLGEVDKDSLVKRSDVGRGRESPRRAKSQGLRLAAWFGGCDLMCRKGVTAQSWKRTTRSASTPKDWE